MKRENNLKITKKEKEKILKNRIQKEKFYKSARLYRADSIMKELKEFFNIESKKYIKEELYFIEFEYKDFNFIVRLEEFSESILDFKKVYIDIIHNKQFIKTLIYDSKNYLISLLALISIYDVKYFKKKK